MRLNPFRTARIAAPGAGAVAAGAAAGALAGVEGLPASSAAAVAALTAVASGAAYFGGRIVRRHSAGELELASQIRKGLGRLHEYLTQSETGRRLPATATLLIQPQEVVEQWIDEMKEESKVAEQFPDDRLAKALSALQFTVRQLRAYRTRRQIEILKPGSRREPPDSDTALLISLLGVGLTDNEAELLLRVASDEGLTLKEAVWLLFLMRDYPEVAHSLEKLLLEIRATSDDDRAERILAHVGTSSTGALQELLTKGSDVVDEILSKDELEQRLGEALYACDSIIG
jgi:hypothetical protein